MDPPPPQRSAAMPVGRGPARAGTGRHGPASQAATGRASTGAGALRVRLDRTPPMCSPRWTARPRCPPAHLRTGCCAAGCLGRGHAQSEPAASALVQWRRLPYARQPAPPRAAPWRLPRWCNERDAAAAGRDGVLYTSPCTRSLCCRGVLYTSPCTSSLCCRGVLYTSPCTNSLCCRGVLYTSPCTNSLCCRGVLYTSPCTAAACSRVPPPHRQDVAVYRVSRVRRRRVAASSTICC
jgi:hypothetical protein